jgi:hypothetical protein
MYEVRSGEKLGEQTGMKFSTGWPLAVRPEVIAVHRSRLALEGAVFLVKHRCRAGAHGRSDIVSETVRYPGRAAQLTSMLRVLRVGLQAAKTSEWRDAAFCGVGTPIVAELALGCCSCRFREWDRAVDSACANPGCENGERGDHNEGCESEDSSVRILI